MRRSALPALLLAAGALAACTPGTAPGPVASPLALDRATVTAPPTVETPSPRVRSSSTAPVASVPPSSDPSSPAQVTARTSTTVSHRSTCHSIMVRVIRGSADRGREFAALQFSNTGAAPCTLAGYPVVTLRLGGRSIGTPSQPDSATDSSFVLAPGDTAESKLNDYTDCQAPLSDAIHVVVPGSPQTVTRPGQLRACTLRVTPLGRPD